MKSSALLVTFSLALLAGPVCAQQPLAGDALKTLVSGKSVDVGTDGTATYKTDGKYDYFSKSNGRTFRGQWSVQGDRLCVNFDAGNQRCDQFLQDGNKVVLKNSGGSTFPVTIR